MASSSWLWDRLAGLYDRRARKDEDLARQVERVRRYLETEARVLDFACGTGVTSRAIAADVGEVRGIDVSTRMIELAREGLRESQTPNVRFAARTIFEERPAEPYDVILAFNVLHVLEDAPAVIRRARELLRTGGLLLCVTPALAEAGVLVRVLLPFVGRLLLLRLSVLADSDVSELLEGSGLRVEESELLGGAIPSYLTVAREPGEG
jgi:2-polyprenyl-3-methyl-5-hydroxy-6-metoxy-1,4-benzoquinol methylase